MDFSTVIWWDWDKFHKLYVAAMRYTYPTNSQNVYGTLNILRYEHRITGDTASLGIFLIVSANVNIKINPIMKHVITNIVCS